MLDANKMTNQILSELRNGIKKKFPDAKPVPFQADLAAAVAKGFIGAIKLAQAVAPTGPPTSGPGTGLLGLSAPAMVKIASAYYAGKVGTKGEALEPLLLGIFTGAVNVLSSDTTVTSVSGFGFPAAKIVNLVPAVATNLILAGFPVQTRQNLMTSASGKTLIEALAQGFCVSILATGLANVPVGGGIPGPVVAILS